MFGDLCPVKCNEQREQSVLQCKPSQRCSLRSYQPVEFPTQPYPYTPPNPNLPWRNECNSGSTCKRHQIDAGNAGYLSLGLRYLSFGHRYLSFGHGYLSFGHRYLLFGHRYLSFGHGNVPFLLNPGGNSRSVCRTTRPMPILCTV